MNIKEEDKLFFQRMQLGITLLLGIWCVIFLIEGKLLYAIVAGCVAVVLGVHTLKSGEGVVEEKGVEKRKQKGTVKVV